MTLGELEFTDQLYGNMTKDVEKSNGNMTEVSKGELSRGQQWEIHLAHIIFLGFVFIFTLVAINLLNAIAFGDVQVSS